MSVAKITDHSEQIRYNGELQISLGKSRYEKNWKNKRMLWSVLLSRLSKSSETGETHAEYMKMSKDQQDSLQGAAGLDRLLLFHVPSFRDVPRRGPSAQILILHNSICRPPRLVL